MASLPPYAELHCRSNFSFLTGASHPEELIERAAELGYSALAITDECSLAGVVRAHVEAQAQKLHLVIGSEIRLTLPTSGTPHARLVLLAQTRRGYGNLSHWITVARRRAEKGRTSRTPATSRARCRTRPCSPACPSASPCSCPRPRRASRRSSPTRCG
jgi:error-prone DNA polymerase